MHVQWYQHKAILETSPVRFHLNSMILVLILVRQAIQTQLDSVWGAGRVITGPCLNGGHLAIKLMKCHPVATVQSANLAAV